MDDELDVEMDDEFEVEMEAEFDVEMDDEFEKGIGPKRFSYKDLLLATRNFSEDGKLGEGGFGGVYKGFFDGMNLDVAVKRVSKGSKQGKKEYVSEVKTISRLRHRNLVQLLGWCHERGEFLLIYEFMPNGSLDSHLFNGKRLLGWAARYKIATGLASALLYLHEEWEQCVVHRDIKSSNVMLDSNFNAKLGDFGLARLVDHEHGLQTTVVAGTRGYLAPECVTTGKASKESDVYSFGVVALEIACGRRPVEPKAEASKVMMVEWVWELYGRGLLLDAVDERLEKEFDEAQIERLMVLGLWCAHPDHNLRPSIKQVIGVLNLEAPLPTLPSKKPVPTELALATRDFSEDGKLGEGGFGGVYKGFLSEVNLDVAVKRVSRDSKQGRKEYASEVKTAGRLRHRNLVQLFGCLPRAWRLPNGSLDSHLFHGKRLLEWAVRYKMAMRLASALLYLHEEGEQ
ncbi:hypothetical protein AAC387_Pa03g3408 [Persea americana]